VTPILVTGGTGYLGREILSQLRAAGVSARSVGRSAGNDIVCDLLDMAATRRLFADHAGATVMHCAATVPRAPDDYRNQDAAADSLAMLSNLVEAGPRRLVYASSMTVYPDGVGIAREDGPVGPLSDYGRAKLEGERLLLNTPSMVTAALRLPGLFGGDRRSGLLYNVAASFAKGGRPSLAATLPQWAAIDVRDAAAMCIRALQADIRQTTVINIGYPEAMSIGDVVSRLAHLFKCPAPDVVAPVFSFDLTRMTALLGPTPEGYQKRLEQLAQSV
jgi:nucleoside-diphosphate-sugar epimerase